MALQPGIRFVAVSRAADRVLVAAYSHKLSSSSKADPFVAVVTRVLGSPQTVEDYPRLTITDREVGTIHYDTSRTCIFLVVTAPDYPQRIAFKCLADLKARFQSSFGEQLHKSAEGGLSKVARQLMTDVCTTFADPASVDRAIGVQRQVDDVKGIMSDSISEMLATRENLEVLEDKTENLRSEAAGFQRKAGALKRALWWRNMKIKIVCGARAGARPPERRTLATPIARRQASSSRSSSRTFSCLCSSRRTAPPRTCSWKMKRGDESGQCTRMKLPSLGALSYGFRFLQYVIRSYSIKSEHCRKKNFWLAAQLSSAYANLPHLLARRRGVVLALVRCRESRVVESGAWVAAVARLESRLLGLR